MKKSYTKPVLDVKAYAQFENVFAYCTNNNKVNHRKKNCAYYVGDWNESQSTNHHTCHHNLNTSN